MPSLSLYTKHSLLSRAIVMATLSTTLLFVGCGSDTPTTRVSETPTNTGESNPTTPLVLTVNSPILLKNVRIRMIDAASSTELGNQIITVGHTATFNIPRAYSNVGNVLVAELSAVNSTSTYYDPALDQDAPLTTTLHSTVLMNNLKRNIKIDPFSEAAYQRALVRAGNITLDRAPISMLTEQDTRDANLEVQSVFRVRATEHGLMFDNRAAISDLALSGSNGIIFTDVIFSVGHVLLYRQTHPNDPAPYLGFTNHIVADMRDGDLDGMTIMGLGDRDGIYLNDPLVTPIVNNDPNHNTTTLLAQDQLNARRGYNLAHGQVIKSTLLPLFLNNSNEYQAISAIDYLPPNAALYGLHSVGAGNYTRAYGLEKGILTQSFVNADGNRLISATEQLIGRYTNSSGCTLEMYPSGRIRLMQGLRTFESTINRELSDSISRTDVNSNNYLLNAITTSDSLPSFIQVRTTGSTVTSATAGRSAQVNPTVLDQTDLTCTF